MSPATARVVAAKTAFLSRASRGGEPEPFSSRTVVAAVGSGIVAAVLGWAVTLLPVLLAWALASPRRTGPGQMLAVSVDFWALAHRGSLSVDGLVVTFAPLLLTAVYVVLFARTSAWLAGSGGAVRGWLAERWWEPALAAAGYAVTGLLLVILGNLGSAKILWWSVVPGLVLVPLLGLAPFVRHAWPQFPWADAAGERWLRTRWLVQAVRPALWGGAAALGGGVLVVLAALVVHAQRVAALHRALGPDTTGTAVLSLGQLLALPNLGVWGLAWSGGATVRVGGADVSLAEAHGGTLPLVPVLGVLPEGGPLPWFAWLALLVPLAAGVVAGMRVERAAILAPRADSLVPAVAACLLVGGAVAVLAWFAGASVTPGRLGVIGVTPLVAAALVAFEMAVGAVVTVLLRRGFVGWRG